MVDSYSYTGISRWELLEMVYAYIIVGFLPFFPKPAPVVSPSLLNILSPVLAEVFHLCIIMNCMISLLI